MSSTEFVPGHRQLVSVVIALTRGGDPAVTPFLLELGYELGALELPMVDRGGHRFTPDLHLVQRTKNLSLLVDCKTSATTISPQQLQSYLSVAGTDVVSQGYLSVSDPRQHQIDAVFFAVTGVDQAIIEVLARLTNARTRVSDGLGLVQVRQFQVKIVHDELTDSNLSSSLNAGWDVDLLQLPLELLPFEASSPDSELAQALLQTLAMFFVERRETFDVEDLCSASNELWPYLRDQHDHIRGRVRRMMRNLRRTALKDWIVKVPGRTEREEIWRFNKKFSRAANVQTALSRRASLYVELLRQGRPPKPEDFADVDQLPLPFTFT